MFYTELRLADRQGGAVTPTSHNPATQMFSTDSPTDTLHKSKRHPLSLLLAAEPLPQAATGGGEGGGGGGS